MTIVLAAGIGGGVLILARRHLVWGLSGGKPVDKPRLPRSRPPGAVATASTPPTEANPKRMRNQPR
jgi:hypothetical protein